MGLVQQPKPSIARAVVGSDKMREQNSRFWGLASALFGVVALCKGVRVPNAWALSQLQITYATGLVKRGLLGQLLYSAHVRSLHAVMACCWLEELLLAVLLSIFTWRSGLLSEQRNPAVVAAFAAGYAVTFLAHLVGYHDIILLALGVSVILIRDTRLRLVVAVPACICALLIHENFLLAVFPAILFSFVVDGEQERNQGERYALLLAAISLLVTLGLAFGASLTPQALARFERGTVARSAYPVDASVFSLLGMSTLDNLKLNLHVIRTYWWWWGELAVILMVMGPLLALLVYSGMQQSSGRRRMLFLCASFAPLLLNLLGWDNVRWACLCTVTTYLNLGVLTRSTPISQRTHSLFQERFAILLIGLGMASGFGLMDGAKVRPYPFFPRALRPAIVRHDGALGEIF
jgi:hypothetical protein